MSGEGWRKRWRGWIFDFLVPANWALTDKKKHQATDKSKLKFERYWHQWTIRRQLELYWGIRELDLKVGGLVRSPSTRRDGKRKSDRPIELRQTDRIGAIAIRKVRTRKELTCYNWCRWIFENFSIKAASEITARLYERRRMTKEMTWLNIWLPRAR